MVVNPVTVHPPVVGGARGPPARLAVRNYLTGIVGHTPRTFRNRQAGWRATRATDNLGMHWKAISCQFLSCLPVSKA